MIAPLTANHRSLMIYYLHLSNILLELIGEYCWHVDEHHDVAVLEGDKKNEEKGSSMFNDSNLDKGTSQIDAQIMQPSTVHSGGPRARWVTTEEIG